MVSLIRLKEVVLRMLAVVPLMAFAYEGVAQDYISVGDGGAVPPSSSTPPASTTSSAGLLLTENPNTSCNNNPCLKAPESSFYRHGEMGYSGSYTEQAINYGATEAITKGAEKLIGKSVFKGVVKVVPVLGDVLDTTELGEGKDVLTPELKEFYANKKKFHEMFKEYEKTNKAAGPSCNKVYSTVDGCHPGHNEQSHPGGCRC